MITQAQIIDDVALTMRAYPHAKTDLPAIRTALNDTMDYYEKQGSLSRARSDRWSQRRMVEAVLREIE